MLAILALCTALVACATITRSRTERVRIESIPVGAKVFVNGAFRGETPVDVSLSRGRIHSLKLTADGHEDTVIETDYEISSIHVVGDIVFGIVWVAVDAITGAWHGTSLGAVRVLMSPAGQDCETGNCDYLAENN